MYRARTLQSGRKPRWRALIAAVSAVIPFSIGVAVTGSAATAAAAPAPPSGWTLTWSDDFNGSAGSGVDSAWKYDTGPGATFGTGEIETMTNSTSNVFLDGNGHLVLRALHSRSDPASGWTSGRIETNAATFGAPAGGVVEMISSIQQPNVTTANGAGYWPAFWMLGSTLRQGVTWPQSGEVDILEDINGRSSVFGTLHCGVNPNGPCKESEGIGSGEHPCAGCQTAYHTYAVQIDRSVSPEEIRWYLDGNEYFSVNASQVPAQTWTDAVDHPFFIIYDLAMGGGFPNAFGGGPNASTISGGQLNIDWVAVYNKAPGGAGGGGTAGASGPVRSGISGKCMDVDGANSANGTAVQLYDCNGTSAQNWTAYSDGTLRALGKCLDANGNGTGNGTKLEIWDCTGGANQVWQAYNGGYRNPVSGRCVDDPSSSTNNFTQLQLWDCNGTNAQKWSTPGGTVSGGSDGGGGAIVGDPITGPGGKCIDVAGDDTGGNGAAVQLWDCQSYAADQHWTYTSSTLHTLGRCMDITSGGTANGTKVQLYDCNGTGAQQWVLQSNGSLLNPQSGRCLDDPSGSTTNGARLQIWDCNGSAAQHWTSAQLNPPSGGGANSGTAQPWAPNVSYNVGDQVTYNGVTYTCRQAHTSQVGWEPPNAPALWQAS